MTTGLIWVAQGCRSIRKERIMSGVRGLVEHHKLPVAVRNYRQRR